MLAKLKNDNLPTWVRVIKSLLKLPTAIMLGYVQIRIFLPLLETAVSAEVALGVTGVVMLVLLRFIGFFSGTPVSASEGELVNPGTGMDITGCVDAMGCAFGETFEDAYG